jgi:hypothetical protein
MLKEKFLTRPKTNSFGLRLENGSRIAVIGGGPAGSFFSPSGPGRKGRD